MLHHLQSQWPLGFLQFLAVHIKRLKLEKALPARFYFNGNLWDIIEGLLKDGRFAFLIVTAQEDLRSVIECDTKTNIGKNEGPFGKGSEDAGMIMYRIALGMAWLQSRNIIHREPKASDVLMDKVDGKWVCIVADFEYSIEIMRIGFWRALEILPTIKDKNAFERSKIFSKKVDVCTYKMTCCKILRGNLPFEGHHPFEDHQSKYYDLVLNGK